MVAYPGLPLDSWYEPTRRSWYLRALEHPGQVVLSSPYLDAVSREQPTDTGIGDWGRKPGTETGSETGVRVREAGTGDGTETTNTGTVAELCRD